ncbi:hypothetical protein HAX54_010067 [Datura stramonium]|uniref:Glycoside hydrolase family 19 catalytic domain-containing protein n=1 Tax=Datura stramonium TaxID=4076 RepID=A0ABS8WVP3_DATST|nr:hypothetical protein [Datura stramonium]
MMVAQKCWCAEDSDCEGKGFYIQDMHFLEALPYPRFATVGLLMIRKREIVAFVISLMRLDTILVSPERKSYGRGPIQLSWNFNYGPAGKDIGFDGLNDPDIVAEITLIAFMTALVVLMNNCHSLLTSDQGFGETIRAINGPLECNGNSPEPVARRVQYYIEYCQQLGVDTGNNLTC